MPCCTKRKQAKVDALAELATMYSTRTEPINGRCPLDNSRTTTKWLHRNGVSVGYLECPKGHILKLKCCHGRRAR